MNNKKNKPLWWKPGVILFTKVSIYIAIPIIVALYVGKFLDNKYNTAPWIFLVLTFISFIISIVSIWRFISKYIDELKEKGNNKK